LKRFLESKVLPWYEKRRLALDCRPRLRAQAFGETVDPHRLEPLARYEVHLDRKLERTLSMLAAISQQTFEGCASLNQATKLCRRARLDRMRYDNTF
jgi:hypothetical protein